MQILQELHGSSREASSVCPSIKGTEMGASFVQSNYACMTPLY